VDEPKFSAWAVRCFGDVAGEFARAVARAIHQAHGLALAAHVSSELATNDAYGVTLHVGQYVQLAAECRDLPGVFLRKPKGVLGRFELVVRDDPPVALYPWRYATDMATSREGARLRTPVSDLRSSLLSLSGGASSGQLTLEQGALDPKELEEQLAEDQALLDQLAKRGRVVTVGYASNPSLGIFDLGWGEVELLDGETGEVAWHYWEVLPPPGGDASGGTAPRRPVTPVDGDGSTRAARFDDAPLKEDLGLRPRPQGGEAPISEPERPQADTRSDRP
jgi:hypothetical protein